METYGKARITLGFLSGALLILSAGAHAFLGWPAMSDALAEVGAGADLSGALAVGWYFGSMAMLVFGLVVLGVTIRRGDRRAVRFIALGYLAFGLTAWLLRDLNPHFLLFIVTGVLLALFSFPRAR